MLETEGEIDIQNMQYVRTYAYLLLVVGGLHIITKYSSTCMGWTRSCPIMPVHLKILIYTFTFSENLLLTLQDDS